MRQNFTFFKNILLKHLIMYYNFQQYNHCTHTCNVIQKKHAPPLVKEYLVFFV